jgi:hypothetical protein
MRNRRKRARSIAWYVWARATLHDGNVQAGDKYVYEGWEYIYCIGMTVSFVTLGVGLYFKPETSLAAWAKNEVLKVDGEYMYSLDRV